MKLIKLTKITPVADDAKQRRSFGGRETRRGEINCWNYNRKRYPLSTHFFRLVLLFVVYWTISLILQDIDVFFWAKKRLFMHFFFVVYLSRLPKEDHRAGKVIQVHQGWRYYDWRGMNMTIVLIEYCVGKCRSELSVSPFMVSNVVTCWLQNKLITVTPDTKVLRAMQLMTGIYMLFGPLDWNIKHYHISL